MKKLIFAASFIALFFASCSDDDNNDYQMPTTGLLVTKTVETDADGTFESNFVYNGNKLVKVTGSDGQLFEVTYVGDNIIKFTYKDGDGVVNQTDNFEYDAQGRLSQFIRIEPLDDLGYKEVYTYDASGNISVETYSGDVTTQTTPGTTASITFANGEVSQIENDFGSTYTYTYDNKNNPMKNVAGFAKISFYSLEASGIMHNITMQDDSADFNDETITYEYNALDYPQKATETNDGDTVTTMFYY